MTKINVEIEWKEDRKSKNINPHIIGNALDYFCNVSMGTHTVRELPETNNTDNQEPKKPSLAEMEYEYQKKTKETK